MPKRIDSLTPEQEARFAEWRDKWIAIGLKTDEADWETFEKAVKVAYKKAGLKQPKVIVRVQSPIVGAFAAPIASKLINDLKKKDGAVRDAIRGTIDGAVGDAVRGAIDGAVGDAVRGTIDGAVRDAIRGTIDGAVGDAIDGAIDGAVRDAIRGTIDGAVGDTIDGAIDGAVGDAIDGAIGGAVRGAIDGAIDGAVGDAVRGTIDGAVRDTIDGAIDGAVRDAIDDAIDGAVRNGWYNRLGGQFWVGGWWGSPSYVSFMTEVAGLETTIDIQERAQSYQDISKSVCWWWPYTNFVMVCNRPSVIRRDDNGQLHSDQEKAIEWPDGWGFHALHGVRFDNNPDLWKKIVNQEMTLEDIGKGGMTADQNAVAIQMLRPDRLLEQVKAKLIDTGIKGTKLYQVDNFLDTGRTEYCIRMTDTSTPREFIEWVPPEVGKQGNAELCQAEAFGIPLEDWLLIEQEA